MPETNTILVSVDARKDIVRLAYFGDIGIEESRQHEQAITEAIAAALPGFYLLTDLTHLNSMDVACMSFIIRRMEFARSHGIARVVRIIPDPSKDIGFNIMSLFHYRRGVQIITCATQAEADRALQ
jgi:anti-anti-sigma regulatory factor